MQGLSELQFSDLILLPGGQGLLKGTPDSGQGLRPVPSDVDLLPIRQAVENEIARRKDRFRLSMGSITFRVAVYADVVQGPTVFLRRLPDTVPDFAALGLPDSLVTWLMSEQQQKGLVVFAGPQASGKTTSAAAYIHARIARYGGHSVSWESPVEMPLSGPCGTAGYCFQGDIEEDALALHIRESYRLASPDLLYVGEILGSQAAAQTLRAALGSSRQMVVTSIHGLSVVAALDRLLTWAREVDGEASCQTLSQCLLAVIFQELDHATSPATLKVPQFLLVPFHERAKNIRAKLRDGQLYGLEENIREQRNRITIQGLEAL